MPEILQITAQNYPRSYEVKQWLRSREIAVQNIITEMGDLLGIGYGSLTTLQSEPYGIFSTGRGLCGLMCSILEVGLKERFKGIVVGTVVARVGRFGATENTSDQANFYTHAWNRFQINEPVILFTDLVHGQVNPGLNRVAIDELSREPSYFPKMNLQGWQSSIPIETRLEAYHGVTKKKLRTADKKQLHYLANSAKELIAG